METNKRAVIYIRVSDPSQVDNNSLDTQEKICKDYLKSKGYELVKVFREEGESAKHVATRTQLTELIKFCADKKNPITYLVVYKMDRLSRNMAEGLQLIAQLAAYGVLVYSATEQFGTDAAGTFLKNVLMAAAQYDNETKAEKVKDNMQKVFRDGLWPFKCPIGYQRPFRSKEENKGLPPIPHPELAPIVSRMFTNAATGIYNKSQLARMMNLEGFGDYYRVEADHKIVHGILSKSFYYGKMYAKKWDEYTIGQHEPLTDEPTWQKAYHYLILKKKNYQYQDEEQYPLKGTLKCEACGHPLTTSPSRGNGGVVPYYECRKKGCKGVRLNANDTHKQFATILGQVKPTKRVMTLFQHMVFLNWDTVIEETRQEVDNYDQRIQTLKDELKSIRKAKDDGLYTLEQAKAEAEEAQQKLTVLEIERSEIRIEQYNTEVVKEFSERFMRNLPLLWDNLDLPKRQALLSKVFQGTIIAGKDKIIRTSKLSPSFELIQSLAEEKSENVTPRGIEPRLQG